MFLMTKWNCSVMSKSFRQMQMRTERKWNTCACIWAKPSASFFFPLLVTFCIFFNTVRVLIISPHVSLYFYIKLQPWIYWKIFTFCFATASFYTSSLTSLAALMAEVPSLGRTLAHNEKQQSLSGWRTGMLNWRRPMFLPISSILE